MRRNKTMIVTSFMKKISNKMQILLSKVYTFNKVFTNSSSILFLITNKDEKRLIN